MLRDAMGAFEFFLLPPGHSDPGLLRLLLLRDAMGAFECFLLPLGHSDPGNPGLLRLLLLLL